MAEWQFINFDQDLESHKILDLTAAMKVPGGMIIRSAFRTGTSMVFVPVSDPLKVDTWIEDNKIHK